MSIKQTIFNHLKNIHGWTTKRKLLAFSVDDYGNIRLHSKRARNSLLKEGVKLNGRFDHLDALDTSQDYEQLFEVLDSVKGKNNEPAIFTPYALSCNTDYEATSIANTFVPQNLNTTYEKLSSEFPYEYSKAYGLLKEGIDKKLIQPQFHGREHLNVHLFNALLKDDNKSLVLNIKHESLAGLPNHPDFPKVKFNQALAFWSPSETNLHKEIIKDGLVQFEKVYGYKSLTFTPPAQQLHPDLFSYVNELGVIGVDKLRAPSTHLGYGDYRKDKNILGRKKTDSYVTIVRNCVFEPNDRQIDWVNFTFNQIKSAFFWNKPAIVSSHRVNYCGHIEQNNRVTGLQTLKKLLNKVVKTWPDVEFVSVDELVKIMQNEE